MSTADPYPPGPPGTPPGPSDKYFEGLTYGRATNALWLGLASLVCCGLFTGIPAIYVGAKALSDIEASRGRLIGRGTAWVGIVLGIVGTVASLGFTWDQTQSHGHCGTRVASHVIRYC
jgi:amino acid transporter